MSALRRLPAFALSLLFVACVLVAPAHAKGGKSGGGGGGASLVLTSDAVVPGPGDMACSATAVVSAGHGEICYTVTVGSLDGVITEIALYQAPAGQAGPKVLRLTPNSIGIYQLKSCVPCDAALVRAIQRNPSAYYIQVNTNLYPGGALRAQLQ